MTELLNNPSFEDNLPPPRDFPRSGFISEGTFLQDWIVRPSSAAIEIVLSPYPPRSNDQINSIDGKVWIDSQGSPGPIDIAQRFQVPPSIDAQVNPRPTIDIKIIAAWENINGVTTNPNDRVQIKLDGHVVKTLGIEDFTLHSQQGNVIMFNVFQTFDVMLKVAPGAHTIEVKDVGPPANVGIALDLVGVSAEGITQQHQGMLA